MESGYDTNTKREKAKRKKKGERREKHAISSCALLGVAMSCSTRKKTHGLQLTHSQWQLASVELVYGYNSKGTYGKIKCSSGDE